MRKNKVEKVIKKAHLHFKAFLKMHEKYYSAIEKDCENLLRQINKAGGEGEMLNQFQWDKADEIHSELDFYCQHAYGEIAEIADITQIIKKNLDLIKEGE